MNGYIHVPFCAHRCGYCAFYSLPSPSGRDLERYLKALARDLKPAHLETLYIGGGTPTLPEIPWLEKFFSLLRRNFSFAPGCEISIEANPETLTPEKVKLLRTFATRISLGVQSFSPALRNRIGRSCSGRQLNAALELVSSAGFPHWNIDLIYAIPGQTLEDFERDLHLAVDCGVDHLSCYNLTPEENAPLGKRLAVDDDLGAAMFECAGAVLETAGLPRYEISNYARLGGECRHNMNVWSGGKLCAFGPSAAGFDGECRYQTQADFEAFCAGTAPELDPLPVAARCNEIFAVNLRTVRGWTPELWSRVPHADPWSRRLEIAQSAARKLPGAFEIGDRVIRLTSRGLLFWDSVAAELL